MPVPTMCSVSVAPCDRYFARLKMQTSVLSFALAVCGRPLARHASTGKFGPESGISTSGRFLKFTPFARVAYWRVTTTNPCVAPASVNEVIRLDPDGPEPPSIVVVVGRHGRPPDGAVSVTVAVWPLVETWTLFETRQVDVELPDTASPVTGVVATLVSDVGDVPFRSSNVSVICGLYAPAADTV